jgi:hypothetical protein
MYVKDTGLLLGGKRTMIKTLPITPTVSERVADKRKSLQIDSRGFFAVWTGLSKQKINFRK